MPNSKHTFTHTSHVFNAARRFFVLTALAAALSACNQNDDDPTAQPDSAKPVIVVSNPTLINGIILDATQPQSLTISPAGRINATDNSGKVSLSIQDVVGLSKSQMVLRANGELIANNITATTAIGRGFVVVRATDGSGNSADSTVYFDISPTASSTQATIKPTQSHSFSFAVMPNIVSASVSMPSNATGVSGQANLVGNNVEITLNTNSSATVGEFKPQVSLTTAEGKVYPLMLTVKVAVDTETTFKGAPQYSIDQSARSVRVTDAGAMDSDGIVGYQYYLIAPGVRIANTDGNFTNVPPGTYTLEVDASGVDGATGAVKVATNPSKPTITIEAPKVDAPTVMTQITG
ncbi:MAG: hypothetical protein KDI39_10110, partial [Pseudomonadales bacterium]|nr:hypothetical protein [Pseudomonadales bacterium]